MSVLDAATRGVSYPYMPSIVGKKRGNQTYNYLVESARVNGKPRIVDQQYLGSAEEVTARLAGAPAGTPERTQHKKFGDLAAEWATLGRAAGRRGHRRGVRGPASRRRGHGGDLPGVGHPEPGRRAVLEAGLRRLVGYHRGPRFTKVAVPATDHRRFWDAMNALDTAKLVAAERVLNTAMVTEFDLDASALALDMTKSATFIDSTNDRAPIARRGHAKQKGHDLRLVGLGLGRHPRRRGAAGVPPLPRGPPRRDPVRRRARRTHLPLPHPVPRGPRRGRTHRGVRRRAEQRRELRAPGSDRAALRRVPAPQ